MLTHALRIARGEPLYAEPSVDFVSFLYTPLYPRCSPPFRRSSVCPMRSAAASPSWPSRVRSCFWSPRCAASRRTTSPMSSRPGQRGGTARRRGRVPRVSVLRRLLRPRPLRLAVAGLRFGGALLLLPGAASDRIVLGALLLVLGFFTKQTAAPFVVAAAGAVTLTSGWRRGLLFSAGGVRLRRDGDPRGSVPDRRMAVDLHLSAPPQPRDLARKDLARDSARAVRLRFVLLVPVVACFVLAALRRRLSRSSSSGRSWLRPVS